MVAARIEARGEQIVAPGAGQRATAEVHGAFHAPHHDDVAEEVEGDIVGALIRGVAKALAPEVVALPVELDDEDVRAASAREDAVRVDTKAEGAGKGPDDHQVAPAIGCDGRAEVVVRAADAATPAMVAVRVDLGDEHRAPAAGHLRAAEDERPGGRTGGADAAPRIDGHAPAQVQVGGAVEVRPLLGAVGVVARQTDAMAPRSDGRQATAAIDGGGSQGWPAAIVDGDAPQMAPPWAELGGEGVRYPIDLARRQRHATEIEDPAEVADHDDVARAVDRQRATDLPPLVTESLAPLVHRARSEALGRAHALTTGIDRAGAALRAAAAGSAKPSSAACTAKPTSSVAAKAARSRHTGATVARRPGAGRRAARDLLLLLDDDRAAAALCHAPQRCRCHRPDEGESPAAPHTPMLSQHPPLRTRAGRAASDPATAAGRPPTAPNLHARGRS